MVQVTQRTIDDIVKEVVPEVEARTGYALGQPGPGNYTVRLIGRADYFSEVYVKNYDAHRHKPYKALGFGGKMRYRFAAFLMSYVINGQYLPSSKEIFLIRENNSATRKEDLKGLV